MNRHITRLPMYLGMAVLVISVLVSAVTIGEQRSITNTMSLAKNNQAVLSLVYTSPDIISVNLSSGPAVSGIDVVLRYNPQNLSILPSTLSEGPNFRIMASNLTEETGRFRISVESKSQTASGVVATFRVRTLGNDGNSGYFIGFDNLEARTQVFRAGTGENILDKTQDVRFSVPD